MAGKDLMGTLECRERQELQDKMASLEDQVPLVSPDQLALLELLETLDKPDRLDHLDPLVTLGRGESEETLVTTDFQEHQGHQELLGSQEIKEMRAHWVTMGILDLQELWALEESLVLMESVGHSDCQALMEHQETEVTLDRLVSTEMEAQRESAVPEALLELTDKPAHQAFPESKGRREARGNEDWQVHLASQGCKDQEEEQET